MKKNGKGLGSFRCLGALAVCAILVFAGCGGGGGSSGSSGGDSNDSDSASTKTASAFPSGLAASSPYDLSTGLAKPGEARQALGGSQGRYNWATTQISNLLSGTNPALCVFTPSLFTKTVTDAGCYGPSVSYTGHPDAGMGAGGGSLPPGDVGIWSATDTTTGEACAAAQMNARMEGVRDRSFAALMGLASMVCVINADSSLSLPQSTTEGSTETVDLTTNMPAISGVTFTAATLSHTLVSASVNRYSYNLDFTYNSNRIVVDMVHVPSSLDNVYEGRLSYRVNDSNSGGNCVAISGVSVTRNGSFVYNRTGANAISVEVRNGEFCGSNVNGLDSNGVVDASDKLVSGTNNDGWGNNFNLFTASYDPVTLVGNYVYSWQAGPLDSNTRVFNAVTSEDSDSGTTDLSSTAFFGFGNDISASDPRNIKGFICNWAGPGNSHSLTNSVQKQVVNYNSTTQKFDSTSASISYAPTNACSYNGSGSFSYDSTGDGTKDTNPATVVPNGLVPVTDSDSDGVFDEIAAAGFSSPSAPSCSNCQ